MQSLFDIPRKVKALSVRRPWAEMIASGAKTIETRTWRTRYRGPLLICESGGNAVCVVRLVDCRPMVEGDWPRACCSPYPAWGWILEDVSRIEPFPVKGRLGLYEVEFPPRLA